MTESDTEEEGRASIEAQKLLEGRGKKKRAIKQNKKAEVPKVRDCARVLPKNCVVGAN